ncbi:uncharacterized protein B0I36DRAFT_238611 [Microdochium trichocladiopsis]|uniref:Hikeshi-like domain-containing protein n=1 Tax=Microdochium trichocladiopsis TaxID=1682393 RepID=A0A9P8YEV4_9PEZI|nr:uncharacterized protein B0I36DRAFT_238611 [Microdochium trichocladiopsis]KAH7035666.1 hypothetical protein B0I36DRAFT_238611 [Microdochium trichocladiopsis]
MADPSSSSSSTQPILGILPAGQPLITQPTSQPSPTSFLYAVPSRGGAGSGHSHFSHVAVFLLPGITLPPNTAAAIYLALNPAALVSGTEAPNFKFLGGVGPGKESAVFKLNADTLPTAPAPASQPGQPAAEVVVLGVNVEDAGSVAERMQQEKANSSTSSNGLASTRPGDSAAQQPSAQELAQRIIQNAYNFLSSFSGQAGEVEVVPLKAFQEWWKKFEGKVRSDPTFLERPQD